MFYQFSDFSSSDFDSGSQFFCPLPNRMLASSPGGKGIEKEGPMIIPSFHGDIQEPIGEGDDVRRPSQGADVHQPDALQVRVHRGGGSSSLIRKFLFYNTNL